MSAGRQFSLFGAPPAAQPGGAPERPPAQAASPEALLDRTPPEALLDPTSPEAPGASPESAVSVSEINAAVGVLLEESFRPCWVLGEVANWRRVASGHCYFTLRDESAQISCVMWRSDAARLPTDPEEGMEVTALGRLSLYEARGVFQLAVRRVEARGEGLWRLAFERLRKKLAAEGLLDPAHKRSLPRIPRRIGVVTSRTGAALRDVLSVVERRAPWTQVVVSHCRVQGAEAAEEIVAALQRLVRAGDCDTIILTRGGGSVEDLWAFNEERVARAIAASPVPTVSAIGHEIDVTIADLVADVRAPTPSAAAELAVPDGAALRADAAALAAGLVAGLRKRIRRGEERTVRLGARLGEGARLGLERREGRIGRLGGRLDALSPLGTLRRGYAVPLDAGGRVLRRIEMFGTEERFSLRVMDGLVRCRTEGTEPVEGVNPVEEADPVAGDAA